ncbi:hypothetical protein [Paenibacillus sp. FJAT-26967]|uniref:hypothetical protein n=1 Tax=Paenibacillus sp. FJAT-26967 TaxID=1729690 RepID=UPI00083986CC|nr:hypothetical protein [Paenibacillus sp. FJAT-26967]
MPRSITRQPSGSGYRTTLLLGAMAAALVTSIIAFPDKALQASLEGITIWWNIVFPALLPFLILSELLTGLGVVHALGTLLDPLTKLLLRLPGVSGWVLAAGTLGGFPAGATLTARLRRERLITRREGERLLALSHLASPVLIITVIGTGFLHSPRLGLMLAAVHYGAALLLAFALPGAPKGKADHSDACAEEDSAGADGPAGAGQPNSGGSQVPPLWKRSARTLLRARQEDGRAFGQLLGDSVVNSVQSLMIVGGYMMIFSVLIHMMTFPEITGEVGRWTGITFASDLVHHLATGLFEIHLGTYGLAGSEAGKVPAGIIFASIAALLGFGGLASHAQAVSALQDTGLRYLPFLIARLLHASISYVLALLMWRTIQGPLLRGTPQLIEVSGAPYVPAASNPSPFHSASLLAFSGIQLSMLLILLTGACLISAAIYRFKHTARR